MGRALRNILFHKDLIILIFLVIVSSVHSRKHRSMSSSQIASASSEKDGGGTAMLNQETEDEQMGTHLGMSSDLQSAASKYSAKYSAANSPYVSVSDAGEYYAYHNPSLAYPKTYGGSVKSPPSASYYYNPLVDSGYQHYYPHERTAREFSTRQSAPSPIFATPDHPEFPPLPVSQASSPPNNYYNFVDMGPEYAEFAMASGGHGGGHGGQGWGWKGKGHGWVNQYVSKVNTDAIGLLGLLGLLSLLSNVLLFFTTTTTTTPMGGRRKRSPYSLPESDEKRYENVHRLTSQVLPSLTLVAHAGSGRLPLNCTHLEVCKTNRIIVKELGFLGRPVGSRLSVAISKLLHPLDHTGAIKHHVDKAGIAGREGKNCEEIYPLCSALSGNERPVLPILIRAADIPSIMHGKYGVNPMHIPKL